jgi:uncharacterized protein related to proFAR isomerase
MLTLDPEKFEQEVSIQADLLAWLAVHGYLCLALRHPGPREGKTRPFILKMVATIETALLKGGIMGPEDIKLIHKVEMEEGNEDFQKGGF